MVLSREGAFPWGPRLVCIPGTSGKAGVRLCSAQSPPWRMCRRGQGRGAAGVPELLFTLRVCAPHLQGLHPQGNQWAPLLERGDRITRKGSRTESSRTSALGLHCWAWASSGWCKWGCSSLQCAGFPLRWLLLLQTLGSSSHLSKIYI